MRRHLLLEVDKAHRLFELLEKYMVYDITKETDRRSERRGRR